MEIKNKIAALTILTAFNFANIGQAAAIDEELAVIAAEQADDDSQEKKSATTAETSPEKKSRRELKAEQKRLKEEQKAAEKKRKEDMKAAEKEIREAQKKSRDKDFEQLKENQRTSTKENFPTVDVVNTPVETVPLERKRPPENIPQQETFEPPKTSTPEVVTPSQISTPAVTTPQITTQPEIKTPQVVTPPTPPPQQTPEPSVGLPNPVVVYANFEDLSKAVHFIPLYIPKKSGFSINSMLAIDGRTAEIKYGRRWEPEVSLNVRTYKRMAGEETKDISGVQGVKWRVDMTSGMTVYIAKIAENKHAAAWAVGDYTFSAQVENLSFAAFHAILADELVDLSRHYYI